MRNIGKRLILISFILALISSAVIFVYLQSLNKPKEEIKKRKILVAAEKIQARTMIDRKMIKQIEVVDDSIFNGYINEAEDIIGKYAKETILANEGFRREKLLDKNGNDLGYKLEENHRALSLNVTGEGGVAHLLQPGDYVDIIVYLPEKKEGQEVIRPDITKIILQNIKVLSIDKTLVRDAETKEEGGKEVPNTFLVTLSVPSDGVEKLVLAEDIGNLKLVLRPLKKEEDVKTKGTVWQDLIIETSSTTEEDLLDGEVIVPNDKNDDTSSQKKVTLYTVKRGDTLRKISEVFYGDPGKYILIKEFNSIGNGDIIVTGEIIKIPEFKK